MRDIRVLGTGCHKCRLLAENAEEAVRKGALEARITKVTDLGEIMRYGVMMTPALVIDGRVVAAGRVPSPDEIVSLASACGPAGEEPGKA